MASKLTYEQAIALIGELVEADEGGVPHHPKVFAMLNAMLGVGCVPTWGDLWVVSDPSHPMAIDNAERAVDRVESMADMLVEIADAIRSRASATKLELQQYRESDTTKRVKIRKARRASAAQNRPLNPSSHPADDGKSPF